MRTRARLWSSIFLVFSFTGCITHAPVSDTFIFQDAEPKKRYTSNTRLGLTLNHGLSYDIAQKARNTEWPQIESRLQPLNPKQRAVGLYVLNYDKARKSSFALTLGTFSAGLDITFKLFGRNYLTGALSGPTQGQVYLMHRALHGSAGGIALGPGYKTISYSFENESTDCTFCLGNRRYSAHSVGIRSVGLIRFTEEGSPQGIKLGVFAGYIPNLESTTFSFSVTLGGI